ncbi:hypothetical protein ABK040_007727 [Willaertia magna]
MMVNVAGKPTSLFRRLSKAYLKGRFINSSSCYYFQKQYKSYSTILQNINTYISNALETPTTLVRSETIFVPEVLKQLSPHSKEVDIETEALFLINTLQDIGRQFEHNFEELTKVDVISHFYTTLNILKVWLEMGPISRDSNSKIAQSIQEIFFHAANYLMDDPFIIKMFDILSVITFVEGRRFVKIPYFTFALSFTKFDRLDLCVRLYEEQIRPRIIKCNEKNISGRTLKSAIFLLPKFAGNRDDLVDEIFAFNGFWLPRKLEFSEVEKVKYDNKVLPQHTGLNECVSFLIAYVLDYFQILDDKMGANFDVKFFMARVNSFLKYFDPPPEVYNRVLNILCKRGCVETFTLFVEVAEREGHKVNVILYNTLLNYYKNIPNITNEKVIKEITGFYLTLKNKNALNQNFLTNLLYITNRHPTVYAPLKDMVVSDLLKETKVVLDSYTLSQVLGHVARKDSLDEAFRYFKESRIKAKERGFSLGVDAYNSMIALVYSLNIKKIDIAFSVLNYLEEDNVAIDDCTMVTVLNIERKLQSLLEKPGEIPQPIVERLSVYRATFDQKLSEIVEEFIAGKRNNYIIVAAALTRKKNLGQYEEVMSVWTRIKDKLPSSAIQDGSIYLLVLSCANKIQNRLIEEDCMEHILDNKTTDVSYPLYKLFLNYCLFHQDSPLFLRILEHIGKYFFKEFVEHSPFAGHSQIKRKRETRQRKGWAIPPPKLIVQEFQIKTLLDQHNISISW